MKNRFLKAQHWQIFALIFGIPMVMQILMSATLFSGMVGTEPASPESFLIGYGISFGLVMLIWIFTLWGWMWSVAIGLQPKLPDGVSMRVTRFKLFFFIPLLYFIFLIGTIFTIIDGSFIELLGGRMGIVLIGLVHLAAMFGIFYCMFFVAKTFKTVELQREVKFGDFVGEFFMVWFLFVGIWILQPKINNMVEKEFDYKDSLI